MSTVANPRRFQALLAVMLAMLLALLGGLDATPNSSELGADHGLAGVSVERAGIDTVPAGKPGSEGSVEETFEGERGGEDDSDPLQRLDRMQIEFSLLASAWTLEVDRTQTLRTRLLVARVGARGPPVG